MASNRSPSTYLVALCAVIVISIAALPVTLTWDGGEARGMIAKVHTRELTRLTIRVSGSPPVGAQVQIECALPERPGAIPATGKVAE